eukprot:CAMPEP_0118669556 /NCGR_PEP_ID=MMETSP0785-20121206/20968_1 /TAXON_ID=91992 /ORGANISM="Bolidomonas pacifica, Strain CCMP 1866" /LENGTH=93 /DNA_ID=CAMNT_0006564255 /DNA_START=188 /DNA_END=469 /DNA_ORIENTATION=-
MAISKSLVPLKLAKYSSSMITFGAENPLFSLRRFRLFLYHLLHPKAATQPNSLTKSPKSVFLSNDIEVNKDVTALSAISNVKGIPAESFMKCG